MKIPEIIFSNEHFVAINKPSGLLSIPDRFDKTKAAASTLLLKRFKQVFVVHRLDKVTSGVLLFALDAETHKYLSVLFEKRKIAKEYIAIVKGHLRIDEGIIDQPITDSGYGKMSIQPKGKPSQTKFRLVESFSQGFSIVSFHPLTGRTHQIRVHAAYMGNPIVGDSIYGDGQPVFLSRIKRGYHLSRNAGQELPLFKRLALHASSLEFENPGGQQVLIKADLPKDMRAFINQLKKWEGKN